ncbi:hypothetical protein GOP47_0011650 [Adiantum capillus-veneris]|uniref:C2 domain-containing protein n=1 Tax=Adiantum capillus-veneris TaxID=13818 RepID=A0A9D4UTM3_ADICA|nr:hypothetical protein GOP47_0011650 [Adiantum capillus-veneris]
MPEGTLEVELIRALNLKDVELFGKSDPYVLFNCGPVTHQSRTIKDGGDSPIWNQSFLFEIPDGIMEISAAILDLERYSKDELMGTVVIPLNDVYAQRQLAPIKFKVQLPTGSFYGELELCLKFFPKVHHGILELHLIEGHDLLSSDVLDKSDPYAVIICHKEVMKSRVLENAGSDPKWDETFVFTIDSDVLETMIKILDKDMFNADDPLGTAILKIKPPNKSHK